MKKLNQTEAIILEILKLSGELRLARVKGNLRRFDAAISLIEKEMATLVSVKNGGYLVVTIKLNN